MTVRLMAEDDRRVVEACKMHDGQLGIIVTDGQYYGVVVQAYDNALVGIGQKSGRSWASRCAVTLKVRLLEAGHTIEVVGND